MCTTMGRAAGPRATKERNDLLDSAALFKHKRINTGEKPFACSKWLLSCVGHVMHLWKTTLVKSHVTFWAGKYFLTCVASFMVFQNTKKHVTFGTVKLLLSSVDWGTWNIYDPSGDFKVGSHDKKNSSGLVTSTETWKESTQERSNLPVTNVTRHSAIVVISRPM